MKRYDICVARLDPVQGSEMGKTRPVVIVSDDLRNQPLQTVVVCPITSQLHPAWRSRLQVRCAGRPAEIAVDQISVLSVCTGPCVTQYQWGGWSSKWIPAGAEPLSPL